VLDWGEGTYIEAEAIVEFPEGSLAIQCRIAVLMRKM